ncbi:Transcription factor HES-1-B [Aphelenchoides besseyi]|nr:Transcription factor HES-1-B [Aphelenchoides besseyi]
MTRLRGTNSTQSSPIIPMVWPKDRKEKKPLMEKHRRNRMNNSMNQLKEKILRHFPTESSKLEKADVLERTVDFVSLLEQKVARLEARCNTENRCLQEIGSILNRPESAALPIYGELKQAFERHPMTQTINNHWLGIPCGPRPPLISSIPIMNPPIGIPPGLLPFFHPITRPAVSTIPLVRSTQQAQKIETHVNDEEDEIDVESVDATEATGTSPAPSTTQDSGFNSSTSPTNNLVWRPF